MTPKEKAEEIYYKFTTYAPLHSNNKQCALIAVDEIRDNLPLISYIQYYWIDVKAEIQKL
jgi:hypothetical protein